MRDLKVFRRSVTLSNCAILKGMSHLHLQINVTYMYSSCISYILIMIPSMYVFIYSGFQIKCTTSS